MPISSMRVIQVSGVATDPRTHDVLIKFIDDSRSEFELRIAAGIAAPIAVTLFSLGNQLATSDNEAVDGQVMVLAGAIPARGPQRQAVLDLVFPGGLHFPVTFSEEMIQILDNAISTLRHTSIERKPPSDRKN